MQQGTGGGGGSSSSGVEGTRVSKAQPAGGSGKKKKAKGGGAKEEKTKKPRASAAATAKKKGSGGSKGKGIAAAKKKGKSERLPLASAPSPLLRCTELILSGGARMSQVGQWEVAGRQPWVTTDGCASSPSSPNFIISPNTQKHAHKQSVFAELLMGWQLFRCPVVSLTLDGTGVGGKGLAFLAQARGDGRRYVCVCAYVSLSSACENPHIHIYAHAMPCLTRTGDRRGPPPHAHPAHPQREVRVVFLKCAGNHRDPPFTPTYIHAHTTPTPINNSALTDGVAASIVDGLAAGPSAVTSLTLHACVPGEALVKR